MTKAKPQQESWREEFWNDDMERFKSILSSHGFPYAILWIEDFIEETISTQRTQILNEVRELVEGMKKVGTEIQERQWCKCGNLPQSKYCDNCRRKVVFKTAHRFTDNEYAHNQALDDLLSALKELERTYFDYLVRPDMIDEQ